MSIERTVILTIIEKIIGLALMIIGASLAYNTYINQSAAGNVAPIFIALGLILATAGFAILIYKAK
ncbi:MAG: hypothetical protein RMJ07_00405 [Nitrososphaerota archaeon]|nr:hypothetical protein [Candidatus Bathyarchaeota archaeon]MDW8048135.1 hypothetical protein [Nitrososphaerota archaeon]